MATYTGNLNLKKPDQSDKIRIADFNGNSDAIDAAIGAAFGVGSNPSIDDAVNSMGEGLAIISNGNTHAAITSGQYVYVRGHGTLAEGLYVATANIAQNGTLSLNNVSAVSGGALNALTNNIITVSTRVGWIINSGIDVVAANGVALISIYPNHTAIINIEARINTKGTGATYSYGVNADAITSTCGKNITPVAGGTAQFFNADGTLDGDSYGEGGTWVKNGQFWTPARNYNGTSVGGWDSTRFNVGQRISGVLYGTWSE